MRNEQLFNEFVQFCDSQPKDKVIDHSYWSSCAVGQFATSKGVSVPNGYILPSDCNDFTGFVEQLFGEPYKDVGENESNQLTYKIVWTDGIPKSYGRFTEFLKKYL
jgi:hypothetical protein